MNERATAMASETGETPDAVARLLDREDATIRALGARLAAMNPPVVVTCARGSSDHAASYLKYLLEIALGIPVASTGPSVASVYGARLRLRGGVMISVSQSGQSPDLIALQAAARESGGLTVALVNVAASPLAAGADVVVPLHAGPEISVAATKSFVSATVAIAALAAAWSGDRAMAAAVAGLPEVLRQALRCDWSAADETVAAASSMFVVGRGPGLAVAQEAALKCKETAALHAEAFSAAEVMHGPMRLVHDRFPVLAFVPDDAAAEANRAALARIVGAGGALMIAATTSAPGTALPVARTGHGLLDPVSMAVSFYRFVERISRLRGFDPDRPLNLRKVTQTL